MPASRCVGLFDSRQIVLYYLLQIIDWEREKHKVDKSTYKQQTDVQCMQKTIHGGRLQLLTYKLY